MKARRIFLRHLALLGWLTLVVSGCARASPSPSPLPCGEDRLVLGTQTFALRPWPAQSAGVTTLPDLAAVAYVLAPPDGEGGGVIVLPPRTENRVVLAATTPGQGLSLVRADCTLVTYWIETSQPTGATPGAELATSHGLTLWVGESYAGEGGWLVRAAFLPPIHAPTTPPTLPTSLPTLGPEETLVVISTETAPPAFQAEISLLEVTPSAAGLEITVEILNYGPTTARLAPPAITLRDANGQVLALQSSHPALPADLPVGQAVTVHLLFTRPSASLATLEVLEATFDLGE